jgi:dihydrolipoamide dehydrogenase
MKTHLAVIGAVPGGYVAAFHAADLGMQVTLIDADPNPGGEPMLAHKASHEARVAVEVIHGKSSRFEPRAIPAVVFTDPELAWTGLTETDARAQNIPIEIAKYSWAASGRATTLDRADGLTKLIIDPDTERVLGVGIVGVGAGEPISEGTLAIEMGALASDLKLTIHPHPTSSETVMEAADVFFGESAHVYKPVRLGVRSRFGGASDTVSTQSFGRLTGSV